MLWLTAEDELLEGRNQRYDVNLGGTLNDFYTAFMSNEATQLVMLFSRTQFCRRRLLGWWPTHLICSCGCSQMQLLSIHFQYSWNTRSLKVIFMWRIPDGTITFAKQANRPPYNFFPNESLYWGNSFTYSDSYRPHRISGRCVACSTTSPTCVYSVVFFIFFSSVSASRILDPQLI